MGTEASAATMAAGAIQAFIDESQTLEAIEYGIRSIELCRGPWGASPAHCAQITAGCQAATRTLGRFIAQDNGTLRLLKAARKEQREIVKIAQECKREIGTARQLRLAMAA